MQTSPRRINPGRKGFTLKTSLILLTASLALGVVLPSVLTSMLILSLLTQAVISGILATSVGLLIRQNGVVSFGHAAFYGLGGYVMALLAQRGIISIELAILLGIVLPTVMALLLGLVIVRIPGVAFSMLTLAIGQAVHEVAIKARPLTGGDEGMTFTLPERIFGLPSTMYQNADTMFIVCWTTLTLVLFGLYWLIRSPFGQLVDAIRENEERARFIGYRTVLPRAIILAVSAAVAAIAGVLFTLYNTFLSPEMLHWGLSGSALVMAIIGGPKVVWGPAFGAIVFFLVKDMAGNVSEHWPIIIGATLIFVTLMLPMGIGGALQRLFIGSGKQEA